MRTASWKIICLMFIVWGGFCVAENAFAQTSPQKMKMTTDIPAEITTPDSVNTRIGTLKFFDGYPSPDTVSKVYDNLDFLRGIDVFLNTCPGASLVAMRDGLRSVGVTNNNSVIVFESLMDSKSLFLTPNTETVYAITWLDLTHGPVVVESPPNVLGMVDDFWFRYVIDMGNAGPDKGKGGRFLFLPPGYKGDVPAGYFAYKSATFGNIMFWRGFVVNGSTKPAVENFHKNAHIYLLSEAANPPQMKFIDTSGVAFNTVHANSFKFYEEVNEIVQEEPTDAQDTELLGQLAAIGIIKGKPFAPDERMKKILTDSAAVANATARSLEFRARDENVYFYPGKAWFSPGAEGSYLWLRDGYRSLDARTMMFYVATGVTPAMFAKMVGAGSQYALAAVDADKNYLDGSKTYKVTLPPNVPAKTFWSFVLYDPQTRSELQTGERFPSISSQSADVKKNADGSYDVYFGPKAPTGKESNWVQTAPGKGFFLILRLYGPLDPWFDKTWQPGEIELMKWPYSGE